MQGTEVLLRDGDDTRSSPHPSVVAFDKTQRSKTLDNSIQLWVIRTILSNYLDNSATYDASARYGRYAISILTSVVGYQN